MSRIQKRCKIIGCKNMGKPKGQHNGHVCYRTICRKHYRIKLALHKLERQ